MKPKIIITMTTWPKRIYLASLAISNFIKNQTEPYDKFYLVLSKTEFSSVDELPYTLKKLYTDKKIDILFLEKNYYSFKRMFVFPKHYNDIVISLDDDTMYPKNLIETVKLYYKLYGNCIYNIFYDIGGQLKDMGRCPLDFFYGIDKYAVPELFTHKLMFFAQCVFMPQTFPLEIVTKYADLKNEISPNDEETWFTYFIMKNNQTISSLPFSYLTDIEEINKNDQSANWLRLSRKCINLNCNCRELQFYITIKYFGYVEEFKRRYPTYWYNIYENMTLDELLAEYENSYKRPLV